MKVYHNLVIKQKLLGKKSPVLVTSGKQDEKHILLKAINKWIYVLESSRK